MSFILSENDNTGNGNSTGSNATASTTLKFITKAQAASILKVSTATINNWVKLGKLSLGDNKKLISRESFEKITLQINAGTSQKLTKRRNKKALHGNIPYKTYISNKENIQALEKLRVNKIDDALLRTILSIFTLKLALLVKENLKINKKLLPFIEVRFNAKKVNKKYIGEDVSNFTFSDDKTLNALLKELLGDELFFTVLCENWELFNEIARININFDNKDDTLGYLYLSLRDIGSRKTNGAYFTQEKVVSSLLQSLWAHLPIEKEITFCDPCCGSGNFLIGLINKGLNPEFIYGFDIDPLSITITKINIYLLTKQLSLNNPNIKELNLKELNNNFKALNTLLTPLTTKFDVILGNPPWGANFSTDELTLLQEKYELAKVQGTESFNLFIEYSLNALKDNGLLAYVLPESLLTIKAHQDTRKMLQKYSSIKFVSYLGELFTKVHCPAITLGVKKDYLGNNKDAVITFKDHTFKIDANRTFEGGEFAFKLTNEEYDCLKKITNLPNQVTLKDNAVFALGIVTGDNQEHLSHVKEQDSELILTGKNFLKYHLLKNNNYYYIKFNRHNLQQVAKTEYYKAPEKLLYRFISEEPIFIYDNKQSLTLNSCNILIPKIKGLDIKYLLAILNSQVASFYLSKRFNFIKLLKSHLCSLPIPMVSFESQQEIIALVERLINLYEEDNGVKEGDKVIENKDYLNLKKLALIEKLEHLIASLYGLSAQDEKIISSYAHEKHIFKRFY